MTPQEKRKSKKEVGAGVIVFRRAPDGLRFLLLYKSKNYWNFPRGTVESEEKSFQAAVRETKEETGLASKDLRMIRNFRAYERFSFRRGKQPIFKIVILYLAETRQRDIRLSTEHQGYAWLSYEEARQFLSRYKNNPRPLKLARDFLMRNQKTR